MQGQKIRHRGVRHVSDASTRLLPISTCELRGAASPTELLAGGGLLARGSHADRIARAVSEHRLRGAERGAEGLPRDWAGWGKGLLCKAVVKVAGAGVGRC